MIFFRLPIILSFILALFYLFQGSLVSCSGASTSQASQQRCHCGAYLTSQFVDKTVSKYNLKVIEDEKIGEGAFSVVNHAMFHNQNEFCFALKTTKRWAASILNTRELDVLKYFKNIRQNQHPNIIKMYKYVRKTESVIVMLELGGQKLKDYFDKWNGQNTNKEKLISKLIKGAAIALEQFHKHGFHMDVHEGNFLVALNPDQSEQNPNMKDSREINCKLIDFDTSIINAENHFPLFNIMAIGNNAPEIRGHIRANITDKADVWAFGLMVNRLYNNIQYLDDYSMLDEVLEFQRNLTPQFDVNLNSRLNQLIKACIQLEPNDRPSMAEIVAFLDGRISHFKYESSGVEQERIGHEHRANEGQVNEQIEDLGRENNQSPRVRGCFGWC